MRSSKEYIGYLVQQHKFNDKWSLNQCRCWVKLGLVKKCCIFHSQSTLWLKPGSGKPRSWTRITSTSAVLTWGTSWILGTWSWGLFFFSETSIQWWFNDWIGVLSRKCWTVLISKWKQQKGWNHPGPNPGNLFSSRSFHVKIVRNKRAEALPLQCSLESQFRGKQMGRIFKIPINYLFANGYHTQWKQMWNFCKMRQMRWCLKRFKREHCEPSRASVDVALWIPEVGKCQQNRIWEQQLLRLMKAAH